MFNRSAFLSIVRRALAPLALCSLFFAATPAPAAAADQIYFSAVDDIAAQLAQRINAETVRIDISAWYLTDSTVYSALLNRFHAGVQVRLIGDRGSIFEIDQATKNTFYYLASQGVPIRLRYFPTWYPEIDHWKTTIFVGQGIVAFGSPNYTPFELTPFSSTNYHDELALFTSDTSLVNAFKTKFDQIWNDTKAEPESLVPTPPYFKNWDDACASESACSDYRQQYPNPVPMVINTQRLEPDYPLPAEMNWGQGQGFNQRLSDEITKESTKIDFVIYRLTVDNITDALLARKAAGVPIRLIVEPNEYLNRKWPEFWITHANVDKLWAAGIPIKWRLHDGLTHMKTLITSTVATIASSNYAAAWQRDQNYFMPASAKPAIWTAIENRFSAMWNDTQGFTNFVPGKPDAPTPESPASGSSGASTTPLLTWDTATFATSYDVYLGTSSAAMSLIGNVPAQMVNNPPSTYSFQVSQPLAANTMYFWKVVSRTNGTPADPTLIASSSPQSFTTGSSGGGSSLPAPWSTQDVGSTGVIGNASYANGVFTVAGAGADVWGSADAFRYVYQPVNGDVTIVARVASMQNTNSFAKAGVMLRESLAAGSAHVIIDVTPTGNVEFMTRQTTNGATSWLSGATQTPPTWLRLVRSGNTVTGSVSSNGSNWTVVGSTTTSMSAAANVGFLVNSHNTSALNTSTFDNVAVSTAPPAPPTAPSSPSPGNGATGVSTSPTLTWTSSGASSYTVQFGTTNPPPQVASGVTAASYTPATLAPSTTYFWQIVASNGGGNTTGPVWSFTTSATAPPAPGTPASPSPGNGATGVSTGPTLTWTASNATSYDVAFGTTNPPAQVATNLSTASYTPSTLANSTTYFWRITAKNAGGTTTGPIWSFTTAAAAATLPSPWVTQDVGSTGVTGNASYASGVFTVSGGGADVWGTADAFRYVYQPANGDVTIVARVASMQNTNSFAKAGLMLRESLAAGAAHVIIDVTPTGNVEFMTRQTTNGATSWLSGATQAPPTWLQLVRSGNTVTGSVSSNGSTWTVVGSTTTSMPASANIGFLVNSHNASALNTSTFDSVAVSSAPPAPPATPASPSPSNGATGVSTTPTLTWTSAGASSYTVQFGTANPPPQVASGLTTASYTPAPLAPSTTYFWRIVASNGGGNTTGPVWSFTTNATPPPPPPPPPSDVVIYASDIAAAGLKGSWTIASDATSPNGTKLVTPDNGVANTSNALASPTDYVDVPFTASANTPYTIWLRVKATANSKYNDSLYVQFSDALSGGAPIYPIGSTSGLSVNLATDATASSLNNWGWQNTSYWLSQATTVTFANSGSHSLRIQIREDGVQFDQIVLSPGTYLNTPPGPVSNDSTIVPKP